MKQIQDSVTFIQGQDEFIPDAHVYVVGDASSEDLSLIDAGLMGKGQYKLSAIQKSGIDLNHIKRVIMTHTHMDHIGCLREIMDGLPAAQLWMHRDEAEPLEKGDEQTVYGMDMFRNLCQAQFGVKPGDFAFSVDRKLQGGETLDMGGMAWEVLHVPGHSIGSIALYHRDRKILIPGDVVYADYAIGRFDLHLANGPQLKDSLMSLAQLQVDVLLPGHNRILEQAPEGYIEETAKQWAPYLT